LHWSYLTKRTDVTGDYLKGQKSLGIVHVLLLGIQIMFYAVPRASSTEPQPLFQDTFDYPDDTRPPNWAPYSGNWLVLGGEYHQNADVAWARTFAGDLSWTDYSIEAKVRGVQDFPSPQKPPVMGVIVRAQGPLSFYWFWLDIDKIQIGRMYGRTQTILAAKTYRSLSQWQGTTYILKVEVEGSAISAYINGTLQLQATDTTFPTGRIGLGTYHFWAAFDNVVVKPIGTPQTGTLSVDTTPVQGEVFVNGLSWGTAPQTREVTVGTYTVSFGAVAEYSTPSPQTVQVTVGTTTSVIGEYVFIGFIEVTRYVISAMDDAAYAFVPSTGQSFYLTTGYKLNMIMRGDIPAVMKAGYRFLDITVPQDASIQSAKLRLNLQMSRYYPTDPDVPLPPGHVVQVYAENSGNARPFTTDKNDFVARSGTSAQVPWTLPAGTVVGEWMEVDITSVVQEIVSRSDWTSGNAVAIFTEYTTPNPAYYIVHSYEGGTTPYPSQITVTYT